MTAHGIFHQLTDVLGVSLLNSKVFSRGLVTEVPSVLNPGHRVSLVGVLCNCRAWGVRVPIGQRRLGGITLLPWKVRRLGTLSSKGTFLRELSI